MKAIVLTRGRIATVDDEDFDRVNQFKWYAIKKGRGLYYGARNLLLPSGKKGIQYLHHFILGKSVRTDHENGDSTDNRRKNLRPATQMQNCQGHKKKRVDATSKYRGVCWYPPSRRWLVQIKVKCRQVYIGYFTSEQDAAKAYDEAARRYFGRFARPNFS